MISVSAAWCASLICAHLVVSSSSLIYLASPVLIVLGSPSSSNEVGMLKMPHGCKFLLYSKACFLLVNVPSLFASMIFDRRVLVLETPVPNDKNVVFINFGALGIRKAFGG